MRLSRAATSRSAATRGASFWSKKSWPRLPAAEAVVGRFKFFRMPPEHHQLTQPSRRSRSPLAVAPFLNGMCPLRPGNNPMKYLLALLLSAGAASGAVPAFTDFNTNQFGTNANKGTVKSGALGTNLTLSGTGGNAPTTKLVNNATNELNTPLTHKFIRNN